MLQEDALREYFKEAHELKKEVRISLHGITSNSKVNEKDIEEAKAIWKSHNTFPSKMF